MAERFMNLGKDRLRECAFLYERALALVNPVLGKKFEDWKNKQLEEVNKSKESLVNTLKINYRYPVKPTVNHPSVRPAQVIPRRQDINMTPLSKIKPTTKKGLTQVETTKDPAPYIPLHVRVNEDYGSELRKYGENNNIKFETVTGMLKDESLLGKGIGFFKDGLKRVAEQSKEMQNAINEKRKTTT